jgi:hypothetical protein
MSALNIPMSAMMYAIISAMSCYVCNRIIDINKCAREERSPTLRAIQFFSPLRTLLSSSLRREEVSQ